MMTCESQIIESIVSSMLSRNDMLHVKGHDCLLALR